MDVDTGKVRQEIERLLFENNRTLAREKLAQASEALRDDLWLWSSRARLEAEEGDSQVALHAFRRAALLAETSGMPAEAIMLLEKALIVADISSHTQDGLALLKDIVRIQPSNVQANYYVGKRLYDSGQYSAAIPYLRIAGPVLKHEQDAFWIYSTALALTGGYEELMHLEPLMDEMAAAAQRPYGPYRHLALARLSLSFDRDRLFDRIRAVESSSAWLEAHALVAQLKLAIKQRKPFSFIRMSNGEARFLSYLSSRVQAILRPGELSEMINSIWQVWFEEEISRFDQQEVLALGEKVLWAVDTADITGIASFQMEKTDHYHFGFLAEMQEMILQPDGRFYTPALVHHELNAIIPFLQPLLRDLPFIGFIGAYSKLIVRLAYHCNIRQAATYLVPGEHGYMESSIGSSKISHFPGVYRHVLETLRVPFEGAVFLVGAGLLGKVYAAKIKELGGIAIDIGTLADIWMGSSTWAEQPGKPEHLRLPELPSEVTSVDTLSAHGNVIHTVPERPILKVDDLSPDALRRRERGLELVLESDATYAIFEDGRKVEIRRDGASITSFGTGWVPVFLYAGSRKVFLLELRHEAGHEGTWFLDSDLNIHPHGFGGLSFNEKELLRSKLQRSYEAIVNFVLLGTVAPALCDRGVLRINPATLRQIFQPLIYEDEGWTTVIPLDMPVADESLLQESLRGELVLLSIDHIRAMMGRKIVDVATDTVRRQAFSINSPVDGRELRTDISICINSFIIAYRFYDKAHDLPFFAVASTHVCKIVALHFPLTNQSFLINSLESRALALQMPFGSIDKALREHVLLFARRLLPYLQAPIREVATLCWHNHLGHHLWQDLTGLDNLQRNLSKEELPPVLVMRAAQTEMFGPIDILFPNFAGRVDREGHDVRRMIDVVYRRKLCLISPADSYIRASLKDRITHYANQAADLDGDRRQLSELTAVNRPIILLGLRVENRTVVNFPHFCEEFVEMIREETNGRAAIIIDGHNSSGEHVFESAGSQGSRSPIDVEHEIARTLQTTFAGSGMIFIDTIGARMHRSIFWTSHCDFFVTPWGAGLAKYKWVANKPGLVLAGQLYQQVGFDLHIYDTPEFLENPTPMTIIDLADVKDVPEDLPLIVINEPQRCNFIVDMKGVRRNLKALLANSLANRSEITAR